MGQQEVTFSQYMFNHQSLNPAYTGSKDYTQFLILHRTQWINFPGAPESQAFTFNHKMSSKYFGMGISGVNDKIGPISSSRLAIDLARSMANRLLLIGPILSLTPEIPIPKYLELILWLKVKAWDSGAPGKLIHWVL